MSEIARFFTEVAGNIEGLKSDPDLRALSRMWARAVGPHKYTYNFTWMGRPVIQLPQDMMAMQEIIWRVKPDVIVETGIAHGGSLVFYASMLHLLGGNGFVVGVDVDIRAHNRREIDAHPLRPRIQMLEGSSVDPRVVQEITGLVKGKRVLVSLDSNHTHDHVLEELRAYAPLVGEGSYLVVFDTLVEDLPASFSDGRPWGPGNSPKTAVRAFLRECDRFTVDEDMDAKLQISVAPGGYLRCVRG